MADAPAYPDLTDTDLAFVVAQTAPDSANPEKLAASSGKTRTSGRP